MAPAPRFRWWHGAVILVAANAVSFWPAGAPGDAAFHTAFCLPSSPPDWLVLPLWLALNITSLVASAVAVKVALHNVDPFLSAAATPGVKPFQ